MVSMGSITHTKVCASGCVCIRVIVREGSNESSEADGRGRLGTQLKKKKKKENKILKDSKTVPVLLYKLYACNDSIVIVALHSPNAFDHRRHGGHTPMSYGKARQVYPRRHSLEI